MKPKGLSLHKWSSRLQVAEVATSNPAQSTSTTVAAGQPSPFILHILSACQDTLRGVFCNKQIKLRKFYCGHEPAITSYQKIKHSLSASDEKKAAPCLNFRSYQHANQQGGVGPLFTFVRKSQRVSALAGNTGACACTATR